MRSLRVSIAGFLMFMMGGSTALLAQETPYNSCVDSGRGLGENAGAMFCSSLIEASIQRSAAPVAERICSAAMSQQCRAAFALSVDSQPWCSAMVSGNVNSAGDVYLAALDGMCPEPPPSVACPLGGKVHEFIWCKFGSTYLGNVGNLWMEYLDQHESNGTVFFHLDDNNGGVLYATAAEVALVHAP